MSLTSAIIFGFHAINSWLQRYPQQIDYLVIDKHRCDYRMQQLLALVPQNIAIKRVIRADLDKLAQSDQHQGVIAVVKPVAHPEQLEDFLTTLTKPLLLILDGVQDPHNLGACLRTANAAGVDAVIAPKDRAAGITPVVTKVASGATVFTPFFQVANLARTLKMLKEFGIWLYGTSEYATMTYHQINYATAVAIVMGSEGRGLRKLTQEHCDFLIKIPMAGTVPSLNVSVATGICLFEVRRQHDAT